MVMWRLGLEVQGRETLFSAFQEIPQRRLYMAWLGSYA
jgi:hypothetical protein